MSSFGERFKRIRVSKGLTQEELADDCYTPWCFKLGYHLQPWLEKLFAYIRK